MNEIGGGSCRLVCMVLRWTRSYQASNTIKAQIKCIDIVVGDMSDALKKKMKEKIPDYPSKTMGLYTVVLIAVGAKYDLTA